MEPPPAVRNRGFAPTGIEFRTSPESASTAVTTPPSNPLIQTTPSLKIGLYEPGGIEIFWRTLLVAGSIRFSVPALSVTIQTLSVLVAIPPSSPAGEIGR